jgi:glycosyltransferase involved in cell wall biosynthesis
MGGAERQALYLVEHLAGLGRCTVEVLAFNDGEALRPKLKSLGVPVHVVPYYFRWPKARRLRALTRLALTLRRKIKPDALLPFVGIHSKAIAQTWPYTNARFCWWNQQDEGRDLGGTAIELQALERASCITSNSFAGRDFLANTYGLDPASIFVYNNGTPLPAVVEEGDIRAGLALGNRRIVSMIANVTSFKDHETLLESWPLVLSQFSGAARPLLVLAGHLKEKATVERLKLKAFELGLSSEDVRFAGPVATVSNLIAASDLVVHSSVTEGCPNSVCEAMAHGRAVVATDISGCRQALGNDAEEALAPPKNAGMLASRAIDMLRNPGMRAAYGERNRKRIATEFSIGAMNAFFQARIEKGLGVRLA